MAGEKLTLEFRSEYPDTVYDLVEGRVVYDAFVLENKKAAIYYHAVPVQEEDT